MMRVLTNEAVAGIAETAFLGCKSMSLVAGQMTYR